MSAGIKGQVQHRHHAVHVRLSVSLWLTFGCPRWMARCDQAGRRRTGCKENRLSTLINSHMTQPIPAAGYLGRVEAGLRWLEVGPWDCRRQESRPRCLSRRGGLRLTCRQENGAGPVISHRSLLLEPLSCLRGFSVALGPSEARRKTGEGHSSLAPGYLGRTGIKSAKIRPQHPTQQAGIRFTDLQECCCIH